MQFSVQRKLERLNASYLEVVGEPFRHFFCPLLMKDEQVELCKAHIINQAFTDTSRRWTVQRSDVDNFFGSAFESMFTNLQHRDSAMEVLLTSGATSKGLRPKLYLRDKEVGYYLAGKRTPPNHSKVFMQGKLGITQFAVKLHPDAMDRAQGDDWQLVLERDCRLAALVSVLKAAHLELFEMLGYRYALSLGGWFLGHTVLGRFFEENVGLPNNQIIASAKTHFASYANLVRPVLEPSADVLRATTEGPSLYICENTTRWAFLILLRTANMVHAVVVPILESPQAIARFNSFLGENGSTLSARWCEFDGEMFRAESNLRQFVWPEAKFDSQ